MSQDNALERPTCVVLVHGTFARGAAWTQPSQSSLCKKLRETLGSATQFDAPEWSGANSHAARVEGGRTLANHLEDLFAQKLPPRLFVIGHSHGGTVITHALRARPELAKAIEGVVFLSTPFIQIRRRPHAVALATLLGLILFFAVVWAASYVEQITQALQWPHWTGRVASFVTWVVVGSLIIGAVYESQPKQKPKAKAKNDKSGSEVELVSRIDLAVDRLREEFSVKHLNPDRTLLVRANADEAAAALAWVQAVSRLLGDAVGASLRLGSAMLPWNVVGRRQTTSRTDLAHRLAKIVGLVFLIVVMLGWFIEAAEGVAGELTTAASWFGFDLGSWVREQFPSTGALAARLAQTRESAVQSIEVAIQMAGAVGIAVLLSLGAIVTLFYRAFGHWFLWTALFVEVSVEPAPPGRWTVCQIEPMDQSLDWKDRQSASLTHSLSYEDARAQRLVARWIRHRLQRTSRAVATVAV